MRCPTPRAPCRSPQFQEVTDSSYPVLYEKFLSALDFVNLNVGFILSFACVLNTNYHDRLLCATLGPIAALAALAGVYTIAEKKNHRSPAAMRTVKREHLSIALFIVFLVYSSVSHIIFQAFMCETLDDGVNYLRADYSLTCTTRKHRAFMVYAAVMVLVYPVGIPATFSWWLFRNRDALANRSSDEEGSDEVQALRDLWDPYKPNRFYYEIVEYARRISLTGLSVFVYPSSAAQVAIVLLLAVAFALISEVLSPFCLPAEAWLYRVGTYTVFLSMYLALLLKVDVSDEDSRSQTVFAGLLIVAHAGIMLAVVLQSLLWLTENRAEEVEERDLQSAMSQTSRKMLCASKFKKRVRDGGDEVP